MTDVFLAPHNDDETLFGAYTCLRHQPLVVVCLRSFVEETWPGGPHYAVRERETGDACALLDCDWLQWTFPDDNPPWEELTAAIAGLGADRVWAPLPEPGGHQHHNAIGRIASHVYPQTVFYATYTHLNGKTTAGELVEPEPGWERVKRQAMACYASQANHPRCAVAFNGWPIDEYLVEQ